MKEEAPPLDRVTAAEYVSWFKALADPTRIQIVSLLAGRARPMNVGEVVAAVSVMTSTHEAGLACTRRSSRQPSQPPSTHNAVQPARTERRLRVAKVMRTALATAATTTGQITAGTASVMAVLIPPRSPPPQGAAGLLVTR